MSEQKRAANLMKTKIRDETNLSGQKMGSKGQRTRRRLIDTTIELLAKTRLRDLRVVDIAQVAETSAATFYLYFEDVTEVVLVAATEVTQSLPDLMELLEHDWDRPGEAGAAMRFVERYIAFWDEHRPLFRARNLAAEEGDQRFVTAREEAVRPLLAALATKIAAAQAAGHVPGGTSASAFAGTLLMMLERLGALSHLYRERPPEISYRQLLVAAAETLNWAAGVGRPAVE